MPAQSISVISLLSLSKLPEPKRDQMTSFSSRTQNSRSTKQSGLLIRAPNTRQKCAGQMSKMTCSGAAEPQRVSSGHPYQRLTLAIWWWKPVLGVLAPTGGRESSATMLIRYQNGLACVTSQGAHAGPRVVIRRAKPRRPEVCALYVRERVLEL